MDQNTFNALAQSAAQETSMAELNTAFIPLLDAHIEMHGSLDSATGADPALFSQQTALQNTRAAFSGNAGIPEALSALADAFPGESWPREIYANWLEHAHANSPLHSELAEKIRTLTPEIIADPALLGNHWQLDNAGLLEHPQIFSGFTASGFPDKLSFRMLEDMLPNAGDLLEAMPITKLYVDPLASNQTNTLGGLMGLWTPEDHQLFIEIFQGEPGFGKIRSLECIGTEFSPAQMTQIFRSPQIYWDGMRKLSFGGGNVMDENAMAALISHSMPALRELGLNNCQLDDHLMGILAHASFINQLTELDLSFNETITDASHAYFPSPLVHVHEAINQAREDGMGL